MIQPFYLACLAHASYVVADEASGVAAGTKIVLKLKSDESSYSKRFSIEQNIRKYPQAG